MTRDGEAVPHEFVADAVETPDGERVVAGIGRDVSERREREGELRRTRELLEQAQRIADVGGWELDLTTDPPEMTWTSPRRPTSGSSSRCSGTPIPASN